MPTKKQLSKIRESQFEYNFQLKIDRMENNINLKKDLRIMKLEDGIEQAIHTIEFLHGCLTDPSYKYAYPEQTLDRVKYLEALYNRQGGCAHSMRKRDCPNCVERVERHKKMEELEKQVENG